MLQMFELDQVLMTDPYCVNAFEKEVAYLKKFDTQRLLAGFYENAGLTMKKMRYPGWENMLIGGHTLGHYLTATAQAYRNASVSAEDKEILFGMMKELIDGLLECQKNSKGKPGFIFGAVILDKNNVELQFDYVEQNKTNIITEAWVPWYTMHKILDGIVNMYELTGYEPALTLGSGLGDWTYNRSQSWSEETRKVVLGIEYGGMNDALYELYRCTGKKEHLIAAHKFDEDALFEKVASGEKNVLNNRHANTTIPKFLGALNRYITVGEEAAQYLEYVKSFWDMVVKKHTYATGGNSEWEHFGEDFVLDAERTNCNNETCNTYNMLKMSRKLFMITGEKKYADYFENTLINAILSSQNPDTGMTMYFQPMASGYFKVYGTEFDKFWCCTGTGMENFTKLNEAVYFKDEENISVNLYFSSVLIDEEMGLTLRQTADLPRDRKVLFELSCREPLQYNLRFRVPDWAFGVKVLVNGEEEADIRCEDENGKCGRADQDADYIVLEREWYDKDVIELFFDMQVISMGLPDCDNVFAFKYGPVLLSADLGTQDMVDGKTGVDVTIPANKIVQNEFLNVKEGTVAEYMKEIDSHFEKDLKELCFTLKGVDKELTFHPHYRKTRERYGVYTYFLDQCTDASDLMEKNAREQIRAEHMVDVVQPGYGQYENDELHAMNDEGSVGSTKDGTSRYATVRGGFSYRMKVEKGKDHILEMHLLRDDNGKVLKSYLGEDEIFCQKLHYTGHDTEYVLEVPISKELIEKHMTKTEQGVDVITIRFTGGMFTESARLFGFLYLLTDYRA